jgi:STE24 endopeptidase
MTTDEMVAILAHETGHYKKRHILWGLLLGTIQTGFILFLFSLFVKSEALSKAFGVEVPNFHVGMIAFGILWSPVSMVTGILFNMLSRRNEYQADEFAVTHYNGNSLASALKKLSARNLSNIMPHPLYVFFNYSHPPLVQRLNHIAKSNN